MNTLPTDILLLLPQWLSYRDVFKLQCISRLFRKVFTPPESVIVFAECWDYLDNENSKSHITIFVGAARDMPPHPSMAKHIFTQGDWRRRYYCWYTELDLNTILPVLKGEQYLTAGRFLDNSVTETLLDTVAMDDNELCITISKGKNYEFDDAVVEYLTGPWTFTHTVPKLECDLFFTDAMPNQIREEEIDKAFIGYLVKGISKTIPKGSYLATNQKGEMKSCHIQGQVSMYYSSLYGDDPIYISLNLDKEQMKKLDGLGSTFAKNKAILQRIANYAKTVPIPS